MKTTIHDFLKAAQEQGHTLKSLVALTKTFPDHLNPDIELRAIPDAEFVDLETFPGVEHANVFSQSEIESFAQAKNRRGNPDSFDEIRKGKTL